VRPLLPHMHRMTGLLLLAAGGYLVVDERNPL
jgi:hypothetical protein